MDLVAASARLNSNFADCPEHQFCHSVYFFVLPKTHHRPTLIAQHTGRFNVSASIALQLRLPPVAVPGWRLSVLWAPVPIAAVYEDCNALPREADVDGSSVGSRDRAVKAKPEP
jgi:hypothetical protein